MSQKIERVNKLLAMCVVLNRNSWRNMLQLIVYSLSKYSIIYSTCYYQSNQSLDTENQYWMPMIFGPLSSTALKTGMIMSWKSLPGLRKTSRSHCLWTQFTVPSIKAMVEGLSCKDKAICKHDPEVLLSSLDQNSFKGKIENCPTHVRLIKFEGWVPRAQVPVSCLRQGQILVPFVFKGKYCQFIVSCCFNTVSCNYILNARRINALPQTSDEKKTTTTLKASQKESLRNPA